MFPGYNNNSCYHWVNCPFGFEIVDNSSKKSQAVCETELVLHLKQRLSHQREDQLKHALDVFDQDKGTGSNSSFTEYFL